MPTATAATATREVPPQALARPAKPPIKRVIFVALLIFEIAFYSPIQDHLDRNLVARFQPDAALQKAFSSSGFELAPGMSEVSCIPPKREWYVARIVANDCWVRSGQFLGLPGTKYLPDELANVQNVGFRVIRSKKGDTFSVDSLPGYPVEADTARQYAVRAATWMQADEQKFDDKSLATSAKAAPVP